MQVESSEITTPAEPLPAHMLAQDDSAELVAPAVPDVFNAADLVAPAVPAAFEPPAAVEAGAPAPVPVTPPAPARPANPRGGRSITPGAVGGTKRTREKLRKATTAEAVGEAIAYGRTVGVADLPAEVSRISRERLNACKSDAEMRAAMTWDGWAQAALATPASSSPAPAAPEAAPAAGVPPEAGGEELGEELGGEPRAEPFAGEAGFMGQDPERVRAFSALAAPYVEFLAELTRGKRLDLTRDVDVVVMEHTPHAYPIRGNMKNRITTLIGVVLADKLNLGSDEEEEGDEKPSAGWELGVLGGGLVLSLFPSPMAAAQSFGRVWIRGSISAARLASGVVGGLLRRRDRAG